MAAARRRRGWGPEPITTMRAANPTLRLKGLAVFVTGLFVALAGWLAWWQIGQADPLRALAQANLRHYAVYPARRGSILDSRGNLLAISVPVKTVCANPSLLGTQQVAVARALAPLVGRSQEELVRLLWPRVRTNSQGRSLTNSYVVLARAVSLERWQQVSQAMANLRLDNPGGRLTARDRRARRLLRERGVFSEDAYLRQYPGGSLAAHVLGYVAVQDEPTEQGQVCVTRGLNGVELSMNEALKGVRGWSRPGEEVAPHPGQTVVLSLDAGVQAIVESELEKAMREHAPASITCLVVRPSTGDVLALANLPTYDPNHPAAAPLAALRNRALCDPTEPGSTFKIVVVSGALEDQAVSLQEPFFCENGSFYFAGTSLRDHKRFGTLTVEQILTKSSNIGAAKVGIRLGPDRLYYWITRFGFGAYTGVPLAGESRGFLRPVKSWQKVSVSRLPMGHELLVTPLQMVMAMAAVANEGRLMRPRLIDRVVDEEGRVVRQFDAELVRPVLTPATARQMVTALKTVVSPEGTGVKARLEYYTVAGKTGTAEKFINGTYDSHRYFSSFIGFFPADRPALCISVVMDDPDPHKGYYGGDVAAPVFKAIAERTANYLRLPPELQPQPEALADSSARGGYMATRASAAAANPGAARNPN